MSCENAEEAAEDAVDHVDSTESAEESEEAASFDFYAIVDFECTCVRHTTERKFKHEIIEFPVVFLNAKTLEVDLEFHRYVRPTEKPELTDFCRELTGIQQAWVDEADTIDVVLRDFYGFLEEHSLFHRPSEGKRCFSFCTDGPMDIQGFLKRETRRKGMCLRACWQTFIDVKRVFGAAFKMKPCGLQVRRVLPELGADPKQTQLLQGLKQMAVHRMFIRPFGSKWTCKVPVQWACNVLLQFAGDARLAELALPRKARTVCSCEDEICALHEGRPVLGVLVFATSVWQNGANRADRPKGKKRLFM
ncbi:3'-5' exoribonuclease 1 (3'-5' exonuclease ERI1) (Eri-1 homolog) (Histone mRNA 3'-end-specific exoribonuclease) (Histone mRNA 3'-exonuclease 1) (Protein 3'hExo) (HEXO) [Durusdinium trenchii]|uniref:3'-5' exoribonuclease 1 (3'-5' exonuclease ERI1) (Eri-1 homolog) (Histone mRNA 3'-end-specific exoribonuclease) (Histone mRNA 3'-exonuclease 1) (Protein 3'hExo) (HEXO) n=1 Tax=Durusdinium trenchii TaxID=1381693 RepID=A0ABP0I9X3_9DINO